MDKLWKSTFLYLANHPRLNQWARQYGLRLGADRWVAGETLESALTVAKRLNQEGFLVTLAPFEEKVQNEQQAKKVANQYIRALNQIAHRQVQAYLSLKLTSLGLEINPQQCLVNLRQILNVAQKYGLFVRIEMEDYRHLKHTFVIYHQLRETFDQVGLVIQANLYRSEQDLRQLASRPTNLRIVKGSYKESTKVAFPEKENVNQNMKHLIQLQFRTGNYAAIATHDEKIIQFTKYVVHKKKVDREKFEFQMCYGIRTDVQRQLLQEGYRVRIYVPYGVDWYRNLMYKLAERPENLGFVVKAILKEASQKVKNPLESRVNL